MSRRELPKGYEPWDVEERWARHWEEDGTFSPDPGGEGEPYSIVIPPPNVTGVLHMGHALNITVQDILCRFHRQKGCKVLWVPGMDHAGIATQNVVERELKKEGKTRQDLGREKFIEKVWAWKEDKGGHILSQIRRLGASVDWTREAFTFDDPRARAVREVFVSLFERGLVYKGDYIVNWCTRCHTALADDEVEHATRMDKLYHLKYPLADGSGHLVVATVRPETMLGDTAVAVHPDDPRFAKYIGRTVTLPLVGREIPVIGDEYVDMEFGTGCLKITPAHDPNDFEIGRKHGLDLVQVIDSTGRMSENAPEKYRGMSMKECSDAVLADLDALGLLGKIEDLEHNVGECYRCKTTIEPHVSTQWFVAMKPLAAKARAAVPADTRIFPEHWTKVYYDWLDNIRDWCISRQIWWGHRIPAWTCQECGELIVAREDPTSCTKCGSADLVRDEDVLDTWFSSALWPFSTLGWPDETPELKTFYPTSVLVTGFDILFFWVARMMMMGLEFMGKVPFHHVYIHALVRDEQGKKMSKSTGNVIDPLAMIDKYGCDSLRFTLAAFAAMGRDIKLSEARIEGYRHFVNKIWNAARFSLMNLPDEVEAEVKADSLPDRWILHRLEEVKAEVERTITEYRFNDYAQALYRFIWSEFCDWYLEMAKPVLYGDDEAAKAATRKVLWTVLGETLTLLHPVMPFVTQEIWSVLPPLKGQEKPEDIAGLPFPELRGDCEDHQTQVRMEHLQGAITGARNMRGELNIAPSTPFPSLAVSGLDLEMTRVFEANLGLIGLLAGAKEVVLRAETVPPKGHFSTVTHGSILVSFPPQGLVDAAEEMKRLTKELDKIDKLAVGIEKKLGNPGFTGNAPADVVEKEKAKLDELNEKRAKLKSSMERLKALLED